MSSSDKKKLDELSSNLVNSLTNQAIYPHSIEFTGSTSYNHGGYIDFHYKQDGSDNTSRIIESGKGIINVEANDLRLNNVSVSLNNHKQAYTSSELSTYTADDNIGVSAAGVKKAIGLFEPKAHTHDDRYYTETEITQAFNTVNTYLKTTTLGTTLGFYKIGRLVFVCHWSPFSVPATNTQYDIATIPDECLPNMPAICNEQCWDNSTNCLGSDLWILEINGYVKFSTTYSTNISRNFSCMYISKN